ncbi:nucleoside hydrolase [Cystobacter fuscus]
MNVIVDTDVGWDDVLSILSLIKNPNVKIVGITVTGCGETHLADGVSIAQALLELGQVDAPVSAGAGSPACTTINSRRPSVRRWMTF